MKTGKSTKSLNVLWCMYLCTDVYCTAQTKIQVHFHVYSCQVYSLIFIVQRATLYKTSTKCWQMREGWIFPVIFSLYSFFFLFPFLPFIVAKQLYTTHKKSIRHHNRNLVPPLHLETVNFAHHPCPLVVFSYHVHIVNYMLLFPNNNQLCCILRLEW